MVGCLFITEQFGILEVVFIHVVTCNGYSVYRPVCEFLMLVLESIFTFWFAVQENLLAWLTDDRGRDQFVVRFGSETEVYWNDARQQKPDPVYHRSVSNCEIFWGWGYVVYYAPIVDT